MSDACKRIKGFERQRMRELVVFVLCSRTVGIGD
jgi:hypothetical protein